MSRAGRPLRPEEAALWEKVIASVRPIHHVRARADAAGSKPPEPMPEPPPPEPKRRPAGRVPPMRTPPPPPRAPERPLDSATLDAGWDRRLSRGLVAPESTIDLHGHTLSSAYDRLDYGLALAIARGDRLLLLVTGRPPRPESERPHARGAIRAAVHDWLAASRHADRIAAVRNAHPRHGGAGALYIVLRRPRGQTTLNY